MVTDPKEWLKQSEYDLATAENLFDCRRYFYAVFMCHLAIEKALKGLYEKLLTRQLPKIHNLVYLVRQCRLDPPEACGRFLIRLNEASVVTRYPDNLDKIQNDFPREVVQDVLLKTREALEWIRKQY